MQETLNFPATATAAAATTSTTIRKPLTSFPTFSRQKTANFPSLSSKTTTNTIHPPPLKPSKIPPLPSTPQRTTPKLPPSHQSLNVISFPNPINNHTPVSESRDVRSLTPDDDNDFREKALYLDSLGLDVLTNLPPSAIISSSSLSDLKSLFDYLNSFDIPSPDLRRIVSMCPDILSLRLRDVASVFTFLLREAHVPASSLRHVIRRRPRLLVSNVESRLRPTLYFLQSIGIHEIHKHTSLLSASVEDKFLPKIHYFEKIGFSYRDSVSMFRKFPALFCYSVKENFEPKFNYFVVEMGRDLKELKEFPQYFSFSLERRIKPRHQSCVENGVCFPLPVMLKMKEEEFRERLDVCCNSSLPRSNSPLWMANNEL